ncbi:hypothetical protein [Oxalicibacterium solurbis]|uniref:Uncharacterized protein n=1 Tax=Oxalicibacterium solurbis TaxID=69280 RepID=A0A8J3AY86_9BURK|nr:hypothetical protein [Oxalicibacterium solurbis]GGI53232.1 hypothetical protein GCM10011430_04060 [Oxalicibacterium solurbis]
MQRNEFTNNLVLRHFDRAREITNNTMFMFAIDAPDNDKDRSIPDSLRQAMHWPEHVKSVYDYKTMFPGVYERLFQFCVISLCSDIEIFFKELFDVYGYSHQGRSFGFFQRVEDVFSALKAEGVELAPVASSIQTVQLAFQVRHIGVHNMGMVDESFHRKTGQGKVGNPFYIDQTIYRSMFDAYVAILEYLDGVLPIYVPDQISR